MTIEQFTKLFNAMTSMLDVVTSKFRLPCSMFAFFDMYRITYVHTNRLKIAGIFGLPDLSSAQPELVATPSDLIRFNKIAIPNNKFQMASGQGSHWVIDSPIIFTSMCSPPLSDICQFYF